MARSQKITHGSVKRGDMKPKKMGKGWSTIRKQRQGSRPVLRITEPVEKSDDKKTGSDEG